MFGAFTENIEIKIDRTGLSHGGGVVVAPRIMSLRVTCLTMILADPGGRVREVAYAVLPR